MKSEPEIADAHMLLEDVLTGVLDMGDVDENIGAVLALTVDALAWVLDYDDALLGQNLTDLRLKLFVGHRP